MQTKDFYTVDVFSSEKYGGNQLAVFTNGNFYPDAEMQQIAREMNYSETTFIYPDANPDGSYRVRIFTQVEEVPFAGHPTLGTAYVILHEYAKGKLDEVVLDLPVGKIPVKVEYKDGVITKLTMRQKAPVFGRTVSTAAVAEMLNLKVDDFDPAFPVEEVSTGLCFLIAPLRTLAAVKASKVQKVKAEELFARIDSKAVLVFCPETYSKENTLNARVFADYYNVPEDPATGSAAGCLDAYLLKHNYFGKNSFDISVEQGYEIGRKSILYLTGTLVDEEYSICVGGEVAPVAKGHLI